MIYLVCLKCTIRLAKYHVSICLLHWHSSYFFLKHVTGRMRIEARCSRLKTSLGKVLLIYIENSNIPKNRKADLSYLYYSMAVEQEVTTLTHLDFMRDSVIIS
jgi:hypothetical protein